MPISFPRTAALALGLALAAPAADAPWVRGGRLDDAIVRGDDVYASRALGFDINYYGNRSREMVVCTNGYAIFGGLAPGGDICAFPGLFGIIDGQPYPRISDMPEFYGSAMVPLFTDLRTNFVTGELGGQIYTSTADIAGRRGWSATWDAVRGYAGPGRVTFQLAIVRIGANHHVMEFNYGALDWGAEGGIGWADDGSFTGERFVAEPLGGNDARPENSRFACRFINGVATNCARNVDLATVPEPGTVALFGGGLALLGAVGARRRRAPATRA